MQRNIYLDHNATTTIRPTAMLAMNEAFNKVGNSSSVHNFGRAVRSIIDESRNSVAALVGGRPTEVIFTSGGTEANNLALRGTLCNCIITSAVEHESVLSGADQLSLIPVDSNGVVEIDAIEEALAKSSESVLVSIMLANNETGVIQPVRQVAEIGHAYGALVHCDAVQGVGKIACDMNDLEVDLLSISGHKIGGPQGVGALVSREGIRIKAINRGGGQERGFRSGTENFPGIAGLGAAAVVAKESLKKFGELSKLRDFLEMRLRAIAPVQIFGSNIDRLPNTSCFTMPGVDAEIQIISLDLEGIAVSSGSACSSGKVGNSHVLKAMGVENSEAAKAIRVSFGWDSQREELDRFVDAWCKLYQSIEKRTQNQIAIAV